MLFHVDARARGLGRGSGHWLCFKGAGITSARFRGMAEPGPHISRQLFILSLSSCGDQVVREAGCAALSVFVLHGTTKSVGLLPVELTCTGVNGGSKSSENPPLGALQRHAAAVIQRAWRLRRLGPSRPRPPDVQALHEDSVLSAIETALERSETSFRHLLQATVAVRFNPSSMVDGKEASATSTSLATQEDYLFAAMAEGRALVPNGLTTMDELEDSVRKRTVVLTRAVDELLSAFDAAAGHARPDLCFSDGRVHRRDARPLLHVQEPSSRWRTRQGSCRSCKASVTEATEATGVELEAMFGLHYEVLLYAPHGVGLDLGLTRDCVIVNKVQPLPDQQLSPAQHLGQILEGDVLLAIDGIFLESLDLFSRVELLTSLGSRGQTGVRLRFLSPGGRPQHQDSYENPFLPMLCGTEHSELSPRVDVSVHDCQSIGSLIEEKAEDPGPSYGTLEELGYLIPSSLRHTMDGWNISESALRGVTSHWLTWNPSSSVGNIEGKSRMPVPRSTRRVWGEFTGMDRSWGLVMGAEEMQLELQNISRDVQEVLAASKAASYCR
jgi:hypothetical protein